MWINNRNRTERHFHALFGVENDRRVILGIVTGAEHGLGRVILTLYGILCNGTGRANKT